MHVPFHGFLQCSANVSMSTPEKNLQILDLKQLTKHQFVKWRESSLKVIDKLQVWIISRPVELEPRLCFNFRMIEFGAKHYEDCAFIQAVLLRDVFLTQPSKDKPANHSIQILFLQKKENSQQRIGVCCWLLTHQKTSKEETCRILWESYCHD